MEGAVARYAGGKVTEPLFPELQPFLQALALSSPKENDINDVDGLFIEPFYTEVVVVVVVVLLAALAVVVVVVVVAPL